MKLHKQLPVKQLPANPADLAPTWAGARKARDWDKYRAPGKCDPMTAGKREAIRMPGSRGCGCPAWGWLAMQGTLNPVNAWGAHNAHSEHHATTAHDACIPRLCMNIIAAHKHPPCYAPAALAASTSTWMGLESPVAARKAATSSWLKVLRRLKLALWIHA